MRSLLLRLTLAVVLLFGVSQTPIPQGQWLNPLGESLTAHAQDVIFTRVLFQYETADSSVIWLYSWDLSGNVWITRITITETAGGALNVSMTVW